MSHRSGPVGNRAVLAAQVADLRAKGLLQREIAEVLGISQSYAADLDLDPAGVKDQARKRSYAQPCVDCGAMTSGAEGRKKEPRCRVCSGRKQGAAMMKWPAERIIQKIQEWNALHGSPPGVADWNPNMARQLGNEARAVRFEEGDWPWFTLAINRFGTWNKAIEAAGFEPRKPYGSRENLKNRRRHNKNPNWYGGGRIPMEAFVLRKNGAGWVEVGTTEARSYKEAVEQLADEPGEYIAIPAGMVFVLAPVEKLVASPRA